MARCVDCEEVITNPLCCSCVSDAIGQWVVSKKLQLDFKPNSEVLSGEICIKCANKINLCAYCFTKDVYETLDETFPELVEEFVEFFHFDLDKKGYAKKYVCG